jgi:hypothetical protein
MERVGWGSAEERARSMPLLPQKLRPYIEFEVLWLTIIATTEDRPLRERISHVKSIFGHLGANPFHESMSFPFRKIHFSS